MAPIILPVVSGADMRREYFGMKRTKVSLPNGEERQQIVALMKKIGWTRLNLLSQRNLLRFGREGEKRQINFEKSEGLLRARYGNKEINLSLDQDETEYRIKKLIEGDFINGR